LGRGVVAAPATEQKKQNRNAQKNFLPAARTKPTKNERLGNLAICGVLIEWGAFI